MTPWMTAEQRDVFEALLVKLHTAKTFNDNYLALPNPNQNQMATQLTRLTREMNGIIRLIVFMMNDQRDMLVNGSDT